MPSSQVQRELDLDYAFANTLEVDETTGEDSGVFCWTMESTNRFWDMKGEIYWKVM